MSLKSELCLNQTGELLDGEAPLGDEGHHHIADIVGEVVTVLVQFWWGTHPDQAGLVLDLHPESQDDTVQLLQLQLDLLIHPLISTHVHFTLI